MNALTAPHGPARSGALPPLAGKARPALMLIMILALLAQAACGRKDDTPESRAHRLEELKKERSRLAADIAALEGQVDRDRELAARGVKDGEPDTARVAARAKPVSLARVGRDELRHYIEVQGQVESDQVVSANAEMPGLIRQVHVREGDRVTRGQLIATLDNSVMESSIAEVRTQLELARTLYERQKDLYDQKIGTEVAYLSAKSQKESLEARLATMRRQSGQLRVVAPMSGVVDQVIARVGGAASPGIPLVRIVNLSELKVTARVAESYLSSLEKGRPVRVSMPGDRDDREIEARVSFISRVVDPTSRTVLVEVALPETENLRPNQTVRVRINDRTRPEAVVVDENILRRVGGDRIVFIAAPAGTAGQYVARARTVSTGLSYNGRIEITKGLSPGDQIITQGYQELVDGQPIAPETAAPARTSPNADTPRA